MLIYELINNMRRAIDMNRFWGIAVLCCALGSVITMPAWAQQAENVDGDEAAADDAPPPLPLRDIQLFAEVYGRIKNQYVDTTDDETLIRNAIRGMLRGLDPHSNYLDPKSFQEIRIGTEGKFGGLGMDVTSFDGVIKVVAPIDGTPAADAGIQAGDLILRLDGKPVNGLSLSEAIEIMRGDPGTDIIITVLREEEGDPFDLTLTRAVIKFGSIRSALLEPGFGYVRISDFQTGTGPQLRSKISDLQKQSSVPLAGLVLDLRNNPGGVLGSAVDVSDAFLDDGLIVSTKGRLSSDEKVFEAKHDDILDGAAMVVLVDTGSASASEIVAGALQDHQRALIVGKPTFGKGSVQTLLNINSGGALKLTTARYYTPSGRSIQAEGIVPDVLSEYIAPGDGDAAANAPRRVRETDLTGHLENDNDANVQKIKRSPLLDTDNQINQALNFLKAMALNNSVQAG